MIPNSSFKFLGMKPIFWKCLLYPYRVPIAVTADLCRIAQFGCHYDFYLHLLIPHLKQWWWEQKLCYGPIQHTLFNPFDCWFLTDSAYFFRDSILCFDMVLYFLICPPKHTCIFFWTYITPCIQIWWDQLDPVKASSCTVMHLATFYSRP